MKLFLPYLLFTSILYSEIYDVSIPENDTASYNYADFRMWVNDSTDTLRGIYWFMHPNNGDSRNIVTDSAYQALADSQDFALMGAHIFNMHMHTGIGDAVIAAMDSFAVHFRHDEISFIPFFINGYSWGGQFAYHFAKWIPERIVGIITQKGGYHNEDPAGDAIDIPMLMFVGEDDLPYRIENLTGIFLNHRPLGAKWALALEQGAGHTQINDDILLDSFFHTVTNLRLPDSMDVFQPVTLNILPDSIGWLGHQDNWVIGSYECYDGVTDSSSWLPSKDVAEHWQNFVSEGSVTDTSDCGNSTPNDSLFSFFPLQIGNKWQYYVDFFGWDSTYPAHYEIIEVIGDTVMPNGEHYFVLDGHYNLSQFIRIDSLTNQIMFYSDLFEEECNTTDLTFIELDPDSSMYETCLFGEVDYSESIDSVGLLNITADSKNYDWQFGGVLQYTFSKDIGISSFSIDEVGVSRSRLVAAEIDGVTYGEFMSTQDNSFTPNQFHLLPPFPNPFNPTVTIQFNIGQENLHPLQLNIYDISGRIVETLIDENFETGEFEIIWDASGFASGVYFAVLNQGQIKQFQKITLLK